MVSAGDCTKFWAMLNAFDGTSKSLEPWAKGTVLGNKVYGPEMGVALREGASLNYYLNIAQIHTEKTNLGARSNDHCNSVWFGASREADLARRDESISRAADLATRYGMDGVHHLINDAFSDVEVWTFDNELYLKSASSSEFYTIEPHLEAHSVSKREETNEREAVFAAISFTGDTDEITGETYDIQVWDLGQFVKGVVYRIDNNIHDAGSEGGCYFKMVNQHSWEQNDSRCSEITAMVLFQESGNYCPVRSSCLYIREGPANGGNNHRATTTYGAWFKSMDENKCDSYQLVSAKQFNCGNN